MGEARRSSVETEARPASGLSRGVSLGFLLALTALAIYLCWLMAQPFLPVLTWAVAIAVVAHPLHEALERHIRHRDLAALLAVIIVTAVLIVPGIFLVNSAVREAAEGLRRLQDFAGSNDWQALLAKQRHIGRIAVWLETNLDLSDSIRSLAGAVSTRAPKVVAASLQSAVLLVIMLFTLFYFFRDHRRIVSGLIHLLPLPDRDSSRLLSWTASAIHATIYGRFAVAAVQGILGGLMFWFLGLGAPLLWGTLMIIFSLVPMLGAFIIWVPAALILGIQGSWVKALILTVWGALVIGLVDNLLYPLIVGDRLRVHSLLVFFSALGGLAAFGASGIVLGPVVLAVAMGLIQLWQQRISPEVEDEQTAG